MAENGFCEDTDSITNCEDDEMMLYKKCSLNVVTFIIVYDENDLTGGPIKRSNTFKPDMAHQIFGETEMIFGYKHLTIDLYYLHNSAKCFVDINSSGKIAETDLYKADDIMKSLEPWIPENCRTNKVDFIADLKREDHSRVFGEIIHTFQAKNNTYKVTLCDTGDEEFRKFHQRFETFMVWFIDGANFIDLGDSRWVIFYVYEERLKNGKEMCSPVGFCTVYKFYLYPNSVRARISQFFVLPTHQRRGIGTQLYSSVFSHLQSLPDVADITVEEPTPVFQKIRDFCDSLKVYKDLEENKINISTQNQKQINQYLKKHKICARQAQRVFDILECTITHKNGYQEYVKFTQNIKKRIANKFDKETRGSKRICNLERVGIITEHIDKNAAVNAEYNRYIDSLEWPVNHLRNHIKNNL